MPTYAYACTTCEHTFEIVQSFSDDSLTVCPECGCRLRKVYNAVGVVFKGSGFYRTDSRSSDQKSSAKGGDGGSPDGKSSADGSGKSPDKGGSTASKDSSSGSSSSPAKASSSTGSGNSAAKSTASS